MIESFWATLKEECCGNTIFATRDEAKKAIFTFIEVYYNRKRLHASLGYMSPADCEKQEKEKRRCSLGKTLFVRYTIHMQSEHA